MVDAQQQLDNFSVEQTGTAYRFTNRPAGGFLYSVALVWTLSEKMNTGGVYHE